MLTLFVISFFVLGWLGTQGPTDIKTMMAQAGTIMYFAFFLLMPIYTKLEATKPVPERVTFK
jgi:ubiquinol-cytochrome c reductase cytochrome b subunit